MNIFTRADFLVLLALGLAERFDARVVLDEVVAVVADVVGQRPQRQVRDARDDGVEEEAIVRDEDDGVRVAVQVLLEPVAGFEVEVVRGLVEQQQARLAEQQPGQGDPHLPAAAERVGRPREVRRLEAEPLQHGRRSSPRCCSRRRAGTDPAGRRSARASARARLRESPRRRAALRARASRPSWPAGRRTRSRPRRTRCARSG